MKSKNIIILHGTCDIDEYKDDKYPSLSNSHWIPWIEKKCLSAGIQTYAPDMLNAYMPNYENWKKEFERYDITTETVLVGHSCGGGFLIRYFSEKPEVKVSKIILVAPWLDPGNSKQNDFFDFVISPNLVSQAGTGIHLFHSTNDMESVQKSVPMILEKIPNIVYREFKNYGHFCLGDIGKTFPELLELILAE